jgi:hypothetical protein
VPDYRPPDYPPPDVKRGALPPMGDLELHLSAADDPAELPEEQIPTGTHRWELIVPLADGRRLHLHCGAATHANLSAMLAAEATDDAEEQLGG